MLLRDGAERTRHRISLGVGKPNFGTVIFLRIEGNSRNLLGMPVFIDVIDGNLDDSSSHGYLDDILVFNFPSSDFRSVRGGAGARRTVVGAANALHCARISGIATYGIHVAQQFANVTDFEERERIRETLELSKDFSKADYNLIVALSSREIMVPVLAEKASFAVNTASLRLSVPTMTGSSLTWTKG